MEKLLEKFFEVKTEIYKYFGEELEYYPIYNYTSEYWRTSNNISVEWGPNKEEVECYCETIHGKVILRGEDFTMILVEGQGCHEEVYHVFDNSKEVKEE
jgi:hypothetical protein